MSLGKKLEILINNYFLFLETFEVTGLDFFFQATIPIAIKYRIPPIRGRIIERLNHPGDFSFSNILHIEITQSTITAIHQIIGISIKKIHAQ